MNSYGKELILDISHANIAKFSHDELEGFVEKLCEEIGMEREDLHFWEYDDPKDHAAAPPHLKGVSLVQFITTSTVVIHTLDDLACVFLNVFSCKEFDAEETAAFCVDWFEGRLDSCVAISRDAGTEVSI